MGLVVHCGSLWFFVGFFLCFLVVLGGSWWSLVDIDGFWWFLLVPFYNAFAYPDFALSVGELTPNCAM